MDVSRFLNRYADGQRNFRKANLSGINLNNIDLNNIDLRLAKLIGTNLSGANLSNAYLDNADLSNANLSGANLSQSYIREANLSGVNLSTANLSGAHLSHAYTNITKQKSSTYVDLRSANLKNAWLEYVILDNANFNGADLSYCRFYCSHLRNALLENVQLVGADLRDTDLTGASLAGSNLDSSNLEESILIGANFSGADLQHTNLSQTKISLKTILDDKSFLIWMIVNKGSEGLSLADVDLSNANLNRANLRNADLHNANLSNSFLGSADISNANLSNANLSNTYLDGSNLSNADLSRANLKGAKLFDYDIPFNFQDTNLNKTNFYQAFFDETTIFPKDFDPVKAGAYLVTLDILEEIKESTIIQEVIEAEGYFNIESIEDNRKRIIREIICRQGQPKFRQQLLEAYNRQCAITDCNVEQALEAAHIYPYKGEDTHKTWNGLLLRADIHTLFDLYLLTVHPETKKVSLAPELKNTTYSELDGKEIKVPNIMNLHPCQEALEWHYKQCKWVKTCK